MPQTAAELLEAANRLPEAERDWLAHELLHPAGDGSTESEYEEAWGEEIKRRLDEIRSGAVETIPGEIVVERMFAKIAKARQQQ